MEIFKKNSQAGLTLIEILIATVILGIMMISVYQITSDSIDTRDLVIYEDRNLLQVERALERINLDFTEIYSPLYYSHIYRPPQGRQGGRQGGRQDPRQRPAPKFLKSDKFQEISHHGRLVPTIESPSRESFIFMTSAHRRKLANTKESTYAWIRYSLRPMIHEPEEKRREGNQRLVRQSLAQDIYSPDHYWEDAPEQTLLNHIRSFSIEYWNPSNQRWVSTIDVLNENKYHLAMIKVNLEWIAADGETMNFERIFRHHWTPYDPASDEAIYREAMMPQNRNDPRGEGRGGRR